MNTLIEQPHEVSRLCDYAKARLVLAKRDPVMMCDWERVLFIHFEVDPAMLQREIPFPLDLFHGRAFLTAVAIHVRRLRTWRCAQTGEFLLKPLAIGELLNVRTYVRWRDEPGIFLMTQWLGSKINLALGPRTYGLPYRLGNLRYHHDHESGNLNGRVVDESSLRRLEYHARTTPEFWLPEAGSLEEFLLEQYTAYTARGNTQRYYHIWHEAWPIAPASVEFSDMGLLTAKWPFLKNATPVAAQYSPGVPNVWLGRPYRIQEP